MNGREQLTIATFGSVNAGKSSIINALMRRRVVETSARAGETRRVTRHRLDPVTYCRSSTGMDLLIVDTPGIAEVRGAKYGERAMRAALAADLVLFVLASDITEVEYQALCGLHAQGKPTIVALNKVDGLSRRARKELLAALHARLDPVIGAENLLEIAAAPVRRVVFADDASAQCEAEHEGEPEVSALVSRIFDIARTEGKALRQLTELLGQLDRTVAEERERRAEAEKSLEKFAAAFAVGVMFNPVPWADLAGGVAILVALFKKLGNIYAVHVTLDEQKSILLQVSQQARRQLGWTVATAVGGTLLKHFPGFGSVAGGAMQAGAAGYFAYIIGKTIINYLENGQRWGPGGLEATLRDIVQSVDKKSVTARITSRVREKMAEAQSAQK